MTRLDQFALPFISRSIVESRSLHFIRSDPWLAHCWLVPVVYSLCFIPIEFYYISINTASNTVLLRKHDDIDIPTSSNINM